VRKKTWFPFEKSQSRARLDSTPPPPVHNRYGGGNAEPPSRGPIRAFSSNEASTEPPLKEPLLDCRTSLCRRLPRRPRPTICDGAAGSVYRGMHAACSLVPLERRMLRRTGLDVGSEAGAPLVRRPLGQGEEFDGWAVEEDRLVVAGGEAEAGRRRTCFSVFSRRGATRRPTTSRTARRDRAASRRWRG
jgi:hypothetical protein